MHDAASYLDSSPCGQRSGVSGLVLPLGDHETLGCDCERIEQRTYSYCALMPNMTKNR